MGANSRVPSEADYAETVATLEKLSLAERARDDAELAAVAGGDPDGMEARKLLLDPRSVAIALGAPQPPRKP
jgi:hypothetical protein